MIGGIALSQFLRYGVVGIFSNGLLYLGYLALTAATVNPKLAMTLIYALGVTQTFILNKHWSFRYGGVREPMFARYCISYGLGYLLNFLALFVLVDLLGFQHQVVQGALILLIAIIIFLLLKFWVFRLNKIPALKISEPNEYSI